MKQKVLNSLNGMGIGLLATLVMGTILTQLGTLFDMSLLTTIGSMAKVFMAAAIGVGVATALNATSYITFATLVTASIGAGAIVLQEGSVLVGIGEPAGAYVAAVVTVVVGKLVSGRTKLDLLIVPAICLIVGGAFGMFMSPAISQVTQLIGQFINEATTWQPFLMGLVISVSMSWVILSPISSAALAASLGLSGLAAGAAVVGCASSMVGFAMSSFKENGLEGLLTQGVGTSKVQFSNAVKNPLIIIPPTIAAAICGVLSTTLFKMECNAIGAGMGSSGLVGQLQTFAVMGADVAEEILILHFILPAIISYVVTHLMKKQQFIKENDLALTYL